jgi:DNA-binding response OmpR family regulator
MSTPLPAARAAGRQDAVRPVAPVSGHTDDHRDAGQGPAVRGRHAALLPVPPVLPALPVLPAPPALSAVTPRALLVDDDGRLTGMVADYLAAAGFAVDTAPTLAAGRLALEGGRFDVLVLDLMLPDGDGLELCRELRARPETRTLPVLMLSARGEPTDRIVGLELGADDYLAKPFEPRELLARLKALLRRASPEADAGRDVMRFGRLEIDVDARQARIDGRACDLTAHQFDLLVLLARSAGRVLSRDQIMDGLKGHAADAFDRSIDVHVSRIRAAIEDDPRTPQRLRTVRGAGYVFVRHQDGRDTA